MGKTSPCPSSRSGSGLLPSQSGRAKGLVVVVPREVVVVAGTVVAVDSAVVDVVTVSTEVSGRVVSTDLDSGADASRSPAHEAAASATAQIKVASRIPTDYDGAGTTRLRFRSISRRRMSSITKTIRLSGKAGDSIEDAVRTVLARAASTVSDIQKFEIVKVGGEVDDSGAPTMFTVVLDITFGIKDPVDHG